MKPMRPLTNSYIEAKIKTKKKLTEASNKLRKTLHEEGDLRATKYSANLSWDHKTNYSLWKATKTIKPPVESEKPLRKPCGAWARSADERAILFANHLSDVFKPNPPKSEFSPPVVQEILDHSKPVEVDLDEFKQIVKQKIKPKKSPGRQKW